MASLLPTDPKLILPPFSPLPQIRGAAPLCASQGLRRKPWKLRAFQAAEVWRAAGARGGDTEAGRDPGCSCPARARDKGPAGGRPAPFSCLLGLSAGNLAGSRADQRLGRAGAWGGLDPARPTLCEGTPAREAPRRPPLCLRLWGEGDEPLPEAAEHQLNARLHPSPSPARSTGAPPCTPLGGKVTAPARASRTAPLSWPETSFSPGRWAMQALGDLAPPGPDPVRPPSPLPPVPQPDRHLSPGTCW